MILFYSDWANKHPGAIVDYQTSNESFKKLAALYRSMGVKNHAFVLALHNPALQGVDPFDPNIDDETALAIALEARENPWFYFREIARVPGQAGDDAIPLRANRANVALWWTFFNHIQILLIQPRQTGKSISTDMLMCYLLNVIGYKLKIGLLTKDDKLRRENVQRLKDICDELPGYINQKRADDVNNGEEITRNELGNYYGTSVPRSSEKLAINLGRGLTLPVVHIDEPPFQPHIGTAVPAMLAGMGAAVERAKSVGAPHGIIMTTTAGKKDDRDGKWVYDNIVMRSAQWTERFLDCDDEEQLIKMVKRASPTGDCMILGSFDHRMLGFTDEWLYNRMRSALQSGQDAERDYLNIWTSGSESSPFKREITEAIALSRQDPLYTEVSAEGYQTRWYIPEAAVEQVMAQRETTLGLDTSEATGRDDISGTCVDNRTGDIVFAFTINDTNTFVFTQWLGRLMVKYKNILLVPERKSTGTGIIDYLLKVLPAYGEDPFKRIFNRVVEERTESKYNEDRYREIIRIPVNQRSESFYDPYKVYFGFATAGAGTYSRNNLYSVTLFNSVNRFAKKIKDSVLITQLLGLVKKNDRINHTATGHDDQVFSWLLVHWFLTEARNLSSYGIDTVALLSEVQARKPETPEETYRRSKQKMIRQEMEILGNQMVNETDEYVMMRLEQKLRVLDRQVIVEDGDVYSLEEMLRTLREKRRVRTQASIKPQYDPIYQGGQTVGSFNQDNYGYDPYGGMVNRFG